MSSTVEEILYKNHSISIDYDHDPECPRDWDNLGIFVTFSPRYTFGDNINNGNIFDSRDELKECIHQSENVICLPVFAYDHSGISLSIAPFSDQWDSSQIGYIYTTPERIKKCGTNEAMAEEILKAEIEIYSQYLNGNVYEFKISGPYDNDDLCGIYGADYAIKCAKEQIDNTMNRLTHTKKFTLMVRAIWANIIQTVEYYHVT